MAKLRTYTVKMIPAQVSDSGRVLSCMVTDFVRVSPTVITAASLDEMEAQVRLLAEQFGQSCAVHIDVPRGQRKPPGFDAATLKLEGIKIEEVNV